MIGTVNYRKTSLFKYKQRLINKRNETDQHPERQTEIMILIYADVTAVQCSGDTLLSRKRIFLVFVLFDY